MYEAGPVCLEEPGSPAAPGSGGLGGGVEEEEVELHLFIIIVQILGRYWKRRTGVFFSYFLFFPR